MMILVFMISSYLVLMDLVNDLRKNRKRPKATRFKRQGEEDKEQNNMML